MQHSESTALGDNVRCPKNSYWAIDGLLLAGEYPGSPDPTATRSKLMRYLDVGVRAFLDLTHPYELTHYSSTLSELATERAIQVEYKRMSIDDMGVPRSIEWMRTIQGQLVQWQKSGVPAYIHCWGGVGRTGTVVACHFVEQGLSPQEALKKLATLWTHMSEEKRIRYPQSPQTTGQLKFVANWIAGQSSGNIDSK